MAKNASSTALVEGIRGRERTMKQTMKPIARMSESAIAPPKLQCTFSKVQQKSVARKKKLVSCLICVPRLGQRAPPAPSRPGEPRAARREPPPCALPASRRALQPAQELGELLDP